MAAMQVGSSRIPFAARIEPLRFAAGMLLLGVICWGATASAQAPPIAGNWTLTFEDEFTGDHVDGAKWKMGQHWSGINGAAGNSPDNISVANGLLTLRAEQRPVTYSGTSYSYASGEITTFKRFRQLNGYFEARIRYDAVTGVWPAFWMMPDRGDYGVVSDNYISYLKFDLSGDPRTSVDSATLNLYVTAADTGGTQNLVVLRVPDDSWTEGAITWNNAPNHDAAWLAQAYNPALAAGDAISFDITDAVNAELAGDKVASLALVDGFMRVVGVSFGSRESGISAERPTLELTSGGVPNSVEPTADAAVRGGSLADANFGADTFLRVREDWRNTSSTYNGGMEMDIMESLGIWGDHWTQHALHWDGYGADHQSTGSTKFSFPATPDGFHTYGVYWEPGLLRFHVDGTQTFEWADPRVATVAGYLLLSLQMGGWDGNWPADDPSLPALMEVDYVRAWSGAACSQTPGDIDGDDAADANDLALLAPWLEGPQVAHATGHACADADRDGDVDLADVDAWMRVVAP